MTKGFALALLALTACSPASEPAPDAVPSWSDNVRAYCDAASPGWLTDLVDRIDRALPDPFAAGSLRFEGLNLQELFDRREGVKELQLRLTAQREGATAQLSAYGEITSGSCVPGDMEVIEGFNRFEPPMRFEVAI